MTDDLQGVTDRQLRVRRQRLAAAVERVELTLPGSLVRQGRRCSSAGCRCRRGELHGPYLYLALYVGGRNRTLMCRPRRRRRSPSTLLSRTPIRVR